MSMEESPAWILLGSVGDSTFSETIDRYGTYCACALVTGLVISLVEAGEEIIWCVRLERMDDAMMKRVCSREKRLSMDRTEYQCILPLYNKSHQQIYPN